MSNDATASRTRGRFAFGRKSGAADLKTHGAFDGTRTEVHYETHILQEMSHNPDLPKACDLVAVLTAADVSYFRDRLAPLSTETKILSRKKRSHSATAALIRLTKWPCLWMSGIPN